jgi:predicted ATPase
VCGPGCPGTHSVDQAGLKLRNLPASASQVLRLMACATTARLVFKLIKKKTTQWTKFKKKMKFNIRQYLGFF